MAPGEGVHLRPAAIALMTLCEGALGTGRLRLAAIALMALGEGVLGTESLHPAAIALTALGEGTLGTDSLHPAAIAASPVLDRLSTHLSAQRPLTPSGALTAQPAAVPCHRTC